MASASKANQVAGQGKIERTKETNETEEADETEAEHGRPRRPNRKVKQGTKREF